MPDKFFEWYEPRRQEYAYLASERIREAIEQSESKKRKELLEAVDSEVGKSIPDREKLDDLKEVIDQYEE